MSVVRAATGGGRRQEILAAARQIVAYEGMAGITVRAVAAKAGIGASTLRHYFPSQADLYSAVSRDLFAVQITDDFIADTALTPRQRLLHSIGQFVKPPAGVPLAEFARALVHTYAGVMAAEESGHALPGRILGDAYAWSHETVSRWLQVLADQGWLRTADVSGGAIALMALLNGLVLDLAVGGIRSSDLDLAIETVVGLLIEE